MQKRSDIAHKLELLAPAKDCEIARQAIIHGADAVYIGADDFGARVAASNSVKDIASLADFAHSFDAKVYVTLNTLIYDEELKRAEELIKSIYHAGVDALIVQDMSILKMDIPPIALHASTQCDTRTPEKAKFLEDCGFSQIVLARELSLEEIRRIAEATTVPLEAFVHGALCVSYSGDCQASLLATGRSANRGECAQMCRVKYSLTDENGTNVAPDAHYLSLRDMNRLDRLKDMADAGISSFKIEGRLKDSDYVRNTVAAYSRALDKIVQTSNGQYIRASSGRSTYNFTPDVNSTFNRRFTNYFLDGRPSGSVKMSSLDSPKWIGTDVATVVSAKGKSIKIRAKATLNNGDGLGYFNNEGQFCGFRLNKIEGDIIFPATPIAIKPGIKLYRNRDKVRDEIMSRQTAVRQIDISAKLRRISESTISLQLTDENGSSIESTVDCEFQHAKTPQSETRRRVIAKFGDSIYKLCEFEDLINESDFTPASVLTELRRQAVKLLDLDRKLRYKFDYRRNSSTKTTVFKDGSLDYHNNVANHLSQEFYKAHGFKVGRKALEVSKPGINEEFRVMTTRYCLRRELDACLRTANANRLPSPLFLRSANNIYRLDFNCAKCEMQVIRPAENRNSKNRNKKTHLAPDSSDILHY